MIIYSQSIASAFEKCWCWEKMALARSERQAAGGTDALIFQQEYRCGASWLFSA